MFSLLIHFDTFQLSLLKNIKIKQTNKEGEFKLIQFKKCIFDFQFSIKNLFIIVLCGLHSNCWIILSASCCKFPNQNWFLVQPGFLHDTIITQITIKYLTVERQKRRKEDRMEGKGGRERRREDWKRKNG